MDKIEQPYKGLLKELQAQSAMDVFNAAIRLIQTQRIAALQLNAGTL